MDKKTLLIKLLEKLIPYRDKAKDLMFLVESDFGDPKFIDELIHILHNKIQTIKKDDSREKLEKAIDIIHKIKEKEESEKANEDLEKLLADI